MSPSHLLILQSQLINFGLNPNEWLLERIQNMNFKIRNRDDQGFVFLGRLSMENQTYQWQSLELISL